MEKIAESKWKFTNFVDVRIVYGNHSIAKIKSNLSSRYRYLWGKQKTRIPIDQYGAKGVFLPMICCVGIKWPDSWHLLCTRLHQVNGKLIWDWALFGEWLCHSEVYNSHSVSSKLVQDADYVELRRIDFVSPLEFHRTAILNRTNSWASSGAAIVPAENFLQSPHLFSTLYTNTFPVPTAMDSSWVPMGCFLSKERKNQELVVHVFFWVMLDDLQVIQLPGQHLSKGAASKTMQANEVWWSHVKTFDSSIWLSITLQLQLP